MIIWGSWYLISIFLMGFFGLKRYSMSHRLVKTFVEIKAEELRAYEAVFLGIEVFLVFSDETIWNNNIILLMCGIIVLLASQWILMRLAVVTSSGLLRYTLERRLESMRRSHRERIRDEFR
ncbi:hypothetical protein IJI28_01990 [Candidatus Saccharibacteria bacterium]|nr:hypothetical protein [Candidatus Saccharibacteria bacterium]